MPKMQVMSSIVNKHKEEHTAGREDSSQSRKKASTVESQYIQKGLMTFTLSTSKDMDSESVQEPETTVAVTLK